MRIAIIGSDGLPARYGGFETFVEQIAPRFAALGHQVVVVGSSVGRTDTPLRIPGLDVVNLPMRANGPQSVPFDLWSFWRVRRTADAILLLGVSAGLFVPLMSLLAGHRRIVVNVDGLESRRAKWHGLAKAFLALSERIAIRSASSIVCDNDGIADIVRARYGRRSTTIAYGNDHVLRMPHQQAAEIISRRYGLSPFGYCLSIARIEPENHIIEMIEGFLQSSLPRYVLVGNFNDRPYGLSIKERVRRDPRILLIDATYDPETLGALRTCCSIYLHGHSVGGTNPSLVEILPYARPIIAYDCVFNRHTLRDSCGYFRSSDDLQRTLDAHDHSLHAPPSNLVDSPEYQWQRIAASYLRELEGHQ